jgi:protein-S-isoprenylcysteine O-methyltransferase Ste14
VSVAQSIARWRVTVGFVFAAIVLWLAQPTAVTLASGAAFALIGEGIRVWAAGHVEKSREVTRSGPYRFTRHPLYLGSSIIGVGVAIASGDLLVAALVIAYLATTITAAIRAEEAHLRQKFGREYDAYAKRTAPPMVRAFSLSRAVHNREHHTVAGLIVAFALLALKLGYPIR